MKTASSQHFVDNSKSSL